MPMRTDDEASYRDRSPLTRMDSSRYSESSVIDMMRPNSNPRSDTPESPPLNSKSRPSPARKPRSHDPERIAKNAEGDRPSVTAYKATNESSYYNPAKNGTWKDRMPPRSRPLYRKSPPPRTRPLPHAPNGCSRDYPSNSY